ncbi:MAG: hypothetical protein D6719_12020 [Candidatus Dadabacteria bacterium]|nr:MAG: hypothetical protein D6719_12020 [Candidatus Dadabacteria bacterium]
MKTKKLSISERVKVYKYRRLGLGIRAISRELGRAPSTISRELKRHGDLLSRDSDYFEQAQLAHKLAHERRVKASKKKMRLKGKEIRHYV